MKRGRESFRRPPRRQEVRNMEDVVEQLERSGCIYFVKTLTKTAILISNTEKTAMLSLPEKFARENGDRIEQWVTLRTHLSHGGSGRPWTVRLSVSESGKVLFSGGFYAFVTGNRLRVGDSLIFVLQEDIRSEFEVYTVRGSQGVPLYPHEGDSTSSDEENSNRSSFPSPSHHQNKREKPFTRAARKGMATPSQYASYFDYHHVHCKKEPTSDSREGRAAPYASHFDYRRVHCKKEPRSDSREGRAAPSPNASHFDYRRVHKKEPTSDWKEWRARPLQFASPFDYQSVIPFFRKRLTASNIGRSDRDPRTNSGQFEFPEGFLRDHASLIQTPVKLQGIHERSRTHVVACRQRPGTRMRVDFLVTDWSKFVKENRLEKGHELQFTLMAHSFFLVRKVY